MQTKSIAELSTTLYSFKESNIRKNISEKIPSMLKIEISASINSFHQEEDTTKKFHKHYIVYDIKLITQYKPWSVSRRYNEFYELNEKLKSLNIRELPEFPPKFFFMSDEKIMERQSDLEEYLNRLFNNVNILNYKEILDFINCPPDVIEIYQKNLNHLNFLKEENNINFYSSLVEFQINCLKNNTDYYHETDISPGNLVIKTFLRDLNDNTTNKSEIIEKFEYFIKNEKNIYITSNNNNTKGNNWYTFLPDEIEIFFNGFDSNITNIHINGFLYHCGNIHNNEVGAKKCLSFLRNILSEYYNPQAEIFLKIFKKSKLENILEMELENHIIKNKDNGRLDAFEVLKKLIGEGRSFEKKVHRILQCAKAEELFFNWYYNVGEK